MWHTSALYQVVIKNLLSKNINKWFKIAKRSVGTTQTRELRTQIAHLRTHAINAKCFANRSIWVRMAGSQFLVLGSGISRYDRV